MGNVENKQNKEQSSPASSWTFGRAVKAFLLADAAMVLYLSLGFAIPSKPMHDAETGGLPEDFYDYSAKISPFTPPAPEPWHAKVEVEKITARGDHPTFVPVPSDPALNASYSNSEVQTFDPTFGATPANASYTEPAADAGTVPTVELRATARELPDATTINLPKQTARPAGSEPPAAAPAGARVETIDARRTT